MHQQKTKNAESQQSVFATSMVDEMTTKFSPSQQNEVLEIILERLRERRTRECEQLEVALKCAQEMLDWLSR